MTTKSLALNRANALEMAIEVAARLAALRSAQKPDRDFLIGTLERLAAVMEAGGDATFMTSMVNEFDLDRMPAGDLALALSLIAAYLMDAPA